MFDHSWAFDSPQLPRAAGTPSSTGEKNDGGCDVDRSDDRDVEASGRLR
jgi:hypothetical protein